MSYLRAVSLLDSLIRRSSEMSTIRIFVMAVCQLQRDLGEQVRCDLSAGVSLLGFLSQLSIEMSTLDKLVMKVCQCQKDGDEKVRCEVSAGSVFCVLLL